MKQKERKLLAALNQSIILLRYQATAVFDGQEKDPPEALRSNFDVLALIYTPHHQTADDYILEALAHAPDPSKETVVSSDYELLSKAKQRGAKTQTVEEFLSRLVKKKLKKKAAKEKEFQESSSEIKRLLKIFEDRLNEE